ncbi:hypothetical protein AcV5_008797 [Taiwanofungus camphoratus]|nr:hypothetical protein AcV5_008797 [Antrodia cinnamomea]
MSAPARESAETFLAHARYGKDKVRVFRVVREGAWHHVVEYNVTALLEGDIDASYTQADNSVVVATDSIKNITYYLAKTSPHVLHPERFAMHLGTHLVSRYAHMHRALVTLEQLRWRRIPVGAGGQEGAHPHAFFRDGEDKRFTRVEIDATAGKDRIVARVTSGITDLLVLKTTGSAFEGFVRDEYTTLAEVDDRILSTSVDLAYTFAPVAVRARQDGGRLVLEMEAGEGERGGTPWDGDAVAARARAATLEVFAVDESASVQATLYKMAERIVTENGRVESVTYTLPNKHYVPVDMGYIGVDNLTPAKADVFVPLAAPRYGLSRSGDDLGDALTAWVRFGSGLISATISRK